MYFKIIFWLIIILLIIFFVFFNVEPKVKISFFPGLALENIPLSLVIIVSAILGFLSGLILAFSKILILQKKIKNLEKTVTSSLSGEDKTID